MLGIATFTMVESTMISATARLITTRPIQRRRSGAGVVLTVASFQVFSMLTM